MFEKIAKKIEHGKPLTRKEALFLLTEAELLAVARLADNIRRKKHPDNRVTFVVPTGNLSATASSQVSRS